MLPYTNGTIKNYIGFRRPKVTITESSFKKYIVIYEIVVSFMLNRDVSLVSNLKVLKMAFGLLSVIKIYQLVAFRNATKALNAPPQHDHGFTIYLSKLR